MYNTDLVNQFFAEQVNKKLDEENKIQGKIAALQRELDCSPITQERKLIIQSDIEELRAISKIMIREALCWSRRIE